jgi:small ligand-binding sensory domain FIST
VGSIVQRCSQADKRRREPVVRISTGLSTIPDPAVGAARAARDAAAGLRGGLADIAVVFAGGAHLAALDRTLEAIHDQLAPLHLVGCGAGGVLGDGHEHESGTAIAVWAAALEGGEAQSFHATVNPEGESGVLEGLPQVGPGSSLIMLSDPFSFPTDGVLDGIARAAPGVNVLGGVASARGPGGDGILLMGERVETQGAVGLSLEGIEVLPCVSQGAAPLGREMTITDGHDDVILELAGRPAVQAIETVIGELPLEQRALLARGLLLGVVIDGGKPEYEQGDFLVRAVTGADPGTGAISVPTSIATGQVVRLHARDARSADADLRRELRLHSAALGGEAPAGALVFSCNGRGHSLFGVHDHDAGVIARELGSPPAAGFFAAGEIGPVGGRSFLHTYTATIAVFPE